MPSSALAIEEDIDVEMAPSSGDDFLMESTPMKPHETVYIEDVEAQAKEAKEDVRIMQKQLKETDEQLKKVKAKNYGDKQKLKKDTVESLEKKRNAENARLKVLRQKAALQDEILSYERRRHRAKNREKKSQEAVEKAKERLISAKEERSKLGPQKKVQTKRHRGKRIRVDFAGEKGPKKGLAADAY